MNKIKSFLHIIIQGSEHREFISLATSLGPNAVVFIITKTCLYNVDPLRPQFYIVKLGFTGVYIIILISAQNTIVVTR